MKITVLAGGLSHEREVSLSSGSLVAGALIRRGHYVCLVDLYTGLAIDGSAPTGESERWYLIARAKKD